MFDLFRSRAKAVRYLLGGLLTLVAVSMVITLIPGFGGGYGGASDQVIAEVGDEVLTARDVHSAIQGQIRAKSLSRETVELVAPTMIQQMVAEMATAYQAKKLGFQVTDADVAQAVRRFIPQLFPGGEFAGNEYYARYLAEMNMTIPQFEERVRQQLLMSKLQTLTYEGVVISPKEVEAEYQRRGATAKISWLKFDAADYRSKVNVTREDMLAELKANAARYQTPPKRSFSVLVADEALLSKAIALPEADLRRAYDANRERYRIQERVKVRHILLMTTGKSPEESAKLKTKAEDLLKQIKGGADFADLARKNSDDPGSKEKGGDLDWIARDQTVPNFEKTAFSLKPKEISGVIQTEYGYHILQVLDKEQGRLKPFEEVKDEIATEQNRQALFERMPVLIEQAREALMKTPGAGEEIARNLNLQFIRGENLAPTDPIPTLGINDGLRNTVFALQEGEVSQVVELAGNKLAVAVLTGITPPRQAELADVESQIRGLLSDRKAQEMAEADARKFEAKLKAENNNLEKAAEQMGLKLKQSNYFTRTDQIDGLGPAAYFGEQPFVNQVGSVIALFRVAATPYFLRIVDRKPADPEKLAEQRDAIVSGLRDNKIRMRREMFEAGLMEKLTKDGTVKMNDAAIKRLIGAYRG